MTHELLLTPIYYRSNFSFHPLLFLLLFFQQRAEKGDNSNKMANYLKLTPSSEKYLASLPKFDESQLNIEAVRSAPDAELSMAIPRPDVDLEQMSIIGTTGLIKVTIYRPSNSQLETLPALIYL
jgi:hypothetical protein